MVKRKVQRYQIAFFGEITFSNLADWLVCLGLCLFMALMVLQGGGRFPETQLIGLFAFSLILVGHACWLAARAAERKAWTLDWRGLTLVPFALFSLLIWQAASVAPWAGYPSTLLTIQCTLIFWVVIHQLRLSQQDWLLLGTWLGLAVICSLAAFNQYFWDPQWAPRIVDPVLGTRSRVVDLFGGTPLPRGPFAQPEVLVALLLPAYAMLAILAAARYLGNIQRLLCGYFALLVAGAILITTNPAAVLTLGVITLLLPGFVGRRIGSAILWVGLITFGVMLIGLVLTLRSPPFVESAVDAWSSETAWAGTVTQGPGLDATGEGVPWLGLGPGSYALLEDRYRSPDGLPEGGPVGLNSGLQLLVGYGLPGTLLLLIPSLYLFLAGLRVWFRLPAEQALDDYDRRGRRLRLMPLEKLVLAITLLALFSFSLVLMLESLDRPIGLILGMVLIGGLLVKWTPSRLMTEVRNPLVTILVVVGFLVAGLVLPYLYFQPLMAERHLALDQRLSRVVMARSPAWTRNREFMDQRLLHLTEALMANPDHASGRVELAQVLIHRRFLEPVRRAELGRLAEAEVRLALQKSDQISVFWVVLGESLWLQGDQEGAEEAFHQALNLAPNSASHWYRYAAWLNQRPGYREAALTAIDRALALDPENMELVNLRRQILIP